MFARSVRWTAGLLLAAVVVVMVGVLLLPRAFGLTPYVVTSGSMRPTFEPGAVVLTKDVPAAELAAGDIVTFQTPVDVTTHRIVERRVVGEGAAAETTFETRGDANNASDTDRLDSRNVLGKVRYAVPGVGYLIELVRTPLGLGALVALFALAAFTGGSRRDEEMRDGTAPHVAQGTTASANEADKERAGAAQ